MSKLHVSRPSPAMVVAVIALIVAISGTAYAAGKIGTKQLKKNAVSTKKIKDDAVTAAKLANNAVTGAKLANGAVGTVVRVGPDVTVGANTYGRADASCNPGERATGGGAFNESNVSTFSVTSSYPTTAQTPTSRPLAANGQTPTGWRVWMRDTSGGPQVVNAVVVCTS